jgi:SAM-dependent methyltransferase
VVNIKRCVQCTTSFDSRDWRCPSCDFQPSWHDGFVSFCEPQGSDGFDPDAFDKLALLEHASFWFRSRNRLVAWALRRYFPGAERLLEIGCGTGYVLEGLSRAHPTLALTGADLHEGGLRHAARRLPGVELMQFDARDIPFDGEFDVVGAFDVIEHVNADEEVLAGMHAAVKPEGGILLTVPQHPWLWSAADVYAEHKRRYRRHELLTKLAAAGFAVRRITSFISLLLPAMIAARMRERVSRRPYDPSREHREAEPAGELMERVVDLERRLIARGVDFPAGGSLLVAAIRL